MARDLLYLFVSTAQWWARHKEINMNNTNTRASASQSVTSKAKNLSSGNTGKIASQTKSLFNGTNFSFGGISLPELAVLGAAGFVVWKNREKIVGLLEDNGITAPSILSGNVSELVQSGISMISGKDSQAHDA
jgi:hypothetical protein